MGLYGLSLPLRRSRIVLARYLTVLLALAFSAVLCGLFGAAMAALGQMEDWGLYLSSAIGALGFSVLLNAILLPLLYRFGAERARILFFGVLGAIVAIGFTVLSLVDVTGWLDGIEHVQWKGMFPGGGGCRDCCGGCAAAFLCSFGTDLPKSGNCEKQAAFSGKGLLRQIECKKAGGRYCTFHPLFA